MGCSASGKEKPQTPAARRRLSVGEVEKPGSEAGQEEGAERGLITTLDQKSIMEIVADTQGVGGRKMSIGSVTDTGKTSFANKPLQQLGDEVDVAEEGLGFTCRKGLKPEAPNQDSWFILKLDTHSLYAVFDGHGQKGHDVSNFVKDALPKLILQDKRFKTEDQPTMLTDAFLKMQGLVLTADRMKKLSAQMSGTTCTVCIHKHATEDEGNTFGTITLAHVADSTAVLGSVKNKQNTAIALTRDHKPDLKDERARIEKNGGRVVFDGYANHRVYAKNARYPGLNMSRCMGDLMGHADCGLSAEPEILVRGLTADDRVLLLCSDGVWEFMKPQEGVDLVLQYKPARAQMAADALAKDAWDRWIREEGGAVVDDITVVLVCLQARTAD